MPGVLLSLESRVELLLRQTPALEEKGLQLEIIDTVFINRRSTPAAVTSRAMSGAVVVSASPSASWP